MTFCGCTVGHDNQLSRLSRGRSARNPVLETSRFLKPAQRVNTIVRRQRNYGARSSPDVLVRRRDYVFRERDVAGVFLPGQLCRAPEGRFVPRDFGARHVRLTPSESLVSYLETCRLPNLASR